jgi:TetR/AcrR family transcriptional regulator, regulator of autoinduction and epiphytic fitness
MRRSTLLDAASELFLRDGYTATTTDAIASRAGMSKKTLYRLFSSKAALFEDLVRARLFEHDIAPQTSSDPGDQLDRLTALLGRFADLLALIRLIVAERRQTETMRDIFTRLLLERDQDVLATWVATEIAAGSLPDTDPTAGGQLIFDLTLSTYLLDGLLEVTKHAVSGHEFDATLRERAGLALYALRRRGTGGSAISEPPLQPC